MTELLKESSGVEKVRKYNVSLSRNRDTELYGPLVWGEASVSFNIIVPGEEGLQKDG